MCKRVFHTGGKNTKQTCRVGQRRLGMLKELSDLQKLAGDDGKENKEPNKGCACIIPTQMCILCTLVCK